LAPTVFPMINESTKSDMKPMPVPIVTFASRTFRNVSSDERKFFGTSDAADAFNAAFRIPNFLQNLFGEGVLSASFIPVYARLLGREEEEEARRLAGAVFTLLALASAVLVLLGVLATPALIALIAPGFSGQKREITIRLVRILFPGAGLLVLSAWCLGVLNSHRRFFLSYTAPVLWNIAIIVTLIVCAGLDDFVLKGSLMPSTSRKSENSTTCSMSPPNCGTLTVAAVLTSMNVVASM